MTLGSYKTIVMGASFRNIGEIKELAGASWGALDGSYSSRM